MFAPLRQRVLALLELFEVGKRVRVEFLSGGDAQRVAIARAPINTPSVIIADEPTAHLDSALSQQFMELMRELKSRGRTVILGDFGSRCRFFVKGRGAYPYPALSGVTFAISIVSLVSFISLYIYEMPSHHCPFCMLQREYGYIGYPLYLALFTGVVAGPGVGVLHPFRFIESIERVLPLMQRKLTAVSVSSFTLFAAIVSYRILSSTFRIA